MAAAVLAQVYAVQPTGPYRFAGICAGSLIAYEMARRLLESGRQVAFLGLINSYRPGTEWFNSGHGLAEIYRQRLAEVSALVPVDDPDNALPAVLEILMAMGEIDDDDLDPAEFFWLQAVYSANMFAQQHYAPQSYPGPVALFFPARYSHLQAAQWTIIAPQAIMHRIDANGSLSILYSPQFTELFRSRIRDGG